MLSYTYEWWGNKRFMIHRDKKGRFALGNRHLPEQWKKNKLESERTEEYKEKHRLLMLGEQHSLGYKFTKKQKENVVKSLLGHKRTLGYKYSEERNKKISNSLKGRVPWNKGKKTSEEVKKKISDSVKKYFDGNEEARKKQSEFMKGKKYSLGFKHNKETKEKHRVSMKKRWEDKEYRESMLKRERDWHGRLI